MQSDPPIGSPPTKAILLDIALNAIVPLILYLLAKRLFSASELNALLIATCFPLTKSVFDLLHRRQLDPTAILVLLGIVASILAISFGGSSRLLLIRESFFTGTIGIACLVSLLPVVPRPMMFYFGRYFAAGKDPSRRAWFDSLWQIPQARFTHRLITLVWGIVFLLEFGIRVVLVYLLPTALFLFVAPVLQGTLIVATIIWTFRYVHNVRKNAASNAVGPARSTPGNPS